MSKYAKLLKEENELNFKTFLENECIANDEEPLDEAVETAAIAGAGFVGGIATSYLAYRSKRAFDSLRQSIRQFLNDPIGSKRRAIRAMVKKFEQDMERLKEMIEERDQLLVQGDDMTVGQMKKARRMTEEIQEQARVVRSHFTDEFADDFVEYVGRDQFNKMQRIIDDAERGTVTFDRQVSEKEQERSKNREPSIIEMIFSRS